MDFSKQIADNQRRVRAQILQLISPSNTLIKGKPADEGEEREWGGKKYKKQGKKWVLVTKDKKGKQDDDDKDKSKKQDDSKSKQSSNSNTNQPSEVSRQEIGQMSAMKDMLDENPERAYEIFQQLSPEAQQKVPQDIVNKLVKQSMQDQDDAADEVFNEKPKSRADQLREMGQQRLDGASYDELYDQYTNDNPVSESVMKEISEDKTKQFNIPGIDPDDDVEIHLASDGKIYVANPDADFYAELKGQDIKQEDGSDKKTESDSGEIKSKLDNEIKKTTQQIEQSLENGASYDDIIDQYTEDGGVGESVLKEIYEGSAKDVSIPYMKEDGLSMYQVSDGSLVLANPDGDFHAYIKSDDKVKKAYEVLGL